MSISHADLILTSDGHIYHLDLAPEELAHTVILVGYPGRVEKVSKYFDKIDTWDEIQIINRTAVITKHINRLWPRPKDS